MTLGIEDDPRSIEKMLAGMNSNLPVNRRSLMDYIENGGYTYRTRAGEDVPIDPAGIELLSGLCDDQEKLTLRLPILVSTDTSSETGGWKVDGRTETAVISRLLARRVHAEDRISLYYPDISALKKQIPGLLFAVFMP